MPRTRLDAGLKELQAKIIALFLAAEEALTTALRFMETGEGNLRSQVIENDHIIDATCTSIEHQVLRLLILQQPLGGEDLRFLTATLYINDNLGRIGDTIVQTAQSLLQATSLYQKTVNKGLYTVDSNLVDQQGHLIDDVFILRGLLFLGQEVQYILGRTRVAFVQRDVEIARTIEADHDMVERRYLPICQNIMEMQAQIVLLPIDQRDKSFLQRITHLLWIAHKFAEIAAYTSNICTRIIFMVKG